ncbi:MAG: hypothetical protein CMM87_05995 [Rickettsiales bacterium]|nr:hypothetical protein [Rickettsiales bacterium]|tara:strand:- start:2233 stop:3036 length:804 start_codon:yes stop_codon:yes gene_type:complete
MRKITTRKPSSSFENLANSTSSSKRSSVMMDGSVGEHFYLKTEKLLPYKKQARKVFKEEDLLNLSETIKEFGVRQPLSVIKSNEPGYYEVISGERRLRAAKLIGLEKVPCIIVSEEANLEEIALIENLQRVDLHPIELGEAYASVIDRNHINVRDLAKKIGVSKSVLAEQLSYSKFPQEIKDYLIDHNITNRIIFRSLMKAKDLESMREIIGLLKKSKPKSRKKNLIRVFSQNGSLSFDLSISNLSKSQLKDLKHKLQNLIDKINEI